MQTTHLLLTTKLLLGLLFAGDLLAQELRTIQSAEGRFSMTLPGEPKISEEKIAGPDGTPTIQKQYVAGNGETGVYLVSYQDNPNLVGADKTKIALAFKVGRDGLKTAFGGEVLDEKSITLMDKFPGREIRLSIPDAGGQGKCRLYLVGPRLYQVMAVGIPSFVGSEETQTILDSFKLIQKAAPPK